MKAKALGTNAHIEFDGLAVRIMSRGNIFERNGVAIYPIEAIIGIQVTASSRLPERPGTFQLVVDPRDASLVAPLLVSYAYYARREFAAVTEEIDAALARLGRPPYIPGPPAPAPGSYTVTAPPPAPSLPAAIPAQAQAHPGGALPAWDLAGQITKLAQLRDTGILTAGEFDAAKAKLLGMTAAEPRDAVA